jgi:alpha-amylase
MTQKLDYLDDLGVNAIWITAPYEQIHGWVSGKNDKFPHFSFHGYYAQDWTFMDQNIGTIEEFRTFVNEAHKRGIRIVMDVVMNHTGYNTYEDMITYEFGGYSETTHGWLAATNGTWQANAKVTDWTTPWSKWWGCWVRAFDGNYGYAAMGGGDLTGQLAGLPDVVTESTTKVSIPTFLRKKWNSELNKTSTVGAGNTTGNKYVDYQLPSISNVDWYNKSGDWRADSKGAPADYLIMWLSAWVREFGIDGFRCDTAKHVDMYRWGQLKDACQSALEAWRNDSTKEDTAGAKSWDESFWMTGECFGWSSTAGQGDYYTTGKFDSMINFSFNASQWGGSGSSGSTPTADTWNSYLSINNNSDSDGNGNRNNALSYVSSHDTGLHRPGNQINLGTMLCLLPGGVQIYYGDESSRPAVDAYGDTDMATRGDMNFGSNTDSVAHWGKVGNFRKYNPAVGAGTGSAYKRTYNGSAGESKVAIGINGTSVDVSGLFANGTTVYNWYDGKSATVSGGKVTFNGGTTSKPILVSDKNPSDFGVTF